ncbi:hypothetical protein ONZ45_g19345 [Pleurotus djamor]|nr:hypothetical protein ONZ45_g19345 [Pleurotus djamor]
MPTPCAQCTDCADFVSLSSETPCLCGHTRDEHLSIPFLPPKGGHPQTKCTGFIGLFNATPKSTCLREGCGAPYLSHFNPDPPYKPAPLPNPPALPAASHHLPAPVLASSQRHPISGATAPPWVPNTQAATQGRSTAIEQHRVPQSVYHFKASRPQTVAKPPVKSSLKKIKASKILKLYVLFFPVSPLNFKDIDDVESGFSMKEYIRFYPTRKVTMKDALLSLNLFFPIEIALHGLSEDSIPATIHSTIGNAVANQLARFGITYPSPCAEFDQNGLPWIVLRLGTRRPNAPTIGVVLKHEQEADSIGWWVPSRFAKPNPQFTGMLEEETFILMLAPKHGTLRIQDHICQAARFAFLYKAGRGNSDDHEPPEHYPGCASTHGRQIAADTGSDFATITASSSDNLIDLDDEDIDAAQMRRAVKLSLQEFQHDPANVQRSAGESSRQAIDHPAADIDMAGDDESFPPQVLGRRPRNESGPFSSRPSHRHRGLGDNHTTNPHTPTATPHVPPDKLSMITNGHTLASFIKEHLYDAHPLVAAHGSRFRRFTVCIQSTDIGMDHPIAEFALALLHHLAYRHGDLSAQQGASSIEVGDDVNSKFRDYLYDITVHS